MQAAVSPTHAQFKVALQKLRSALSAKAQLQVRNNTLFCPIAMEFAPPNRLHSRRVKSYLRGVADVIKQVNEKFRASGVFVFDAEHSADAFPFVFESIAVDVRWLKMVFGARANLIKVAELGAHVHEELSKVEIGHVSALWQLSAGEMGAALAAFVNHSSAQAPKSEDRIPRYLTTELHFSHTGARTATKVTPRYVRKFIAMCSALAVAQEIGSVTLIDVLCGYWGDVQYKMWQWLAYALFSNSSTSSVKTLAIEDGYFSEGDRDAIVSIIEARNPSKLLFDRDVFYVLRL